MKLTFYNPVKIFLEKDCVSNHAEVFAECGNRAMIVTGRHSAKACGAQDDVIRVLTGNQIEYCIFDKIENNPSMESVTEAAKIARQERINFVIGIGGGSPLDAAKAISVLAANEELQVEELFKNDFTKAFPVIAIPTTSGTGSEVTPYSVLLNKRKETKLSFGNAHTFSKYALLDAKYTYSLSNDFSIATAVDAFTHVFEGYLAKRSNLISEQLSREGIRLFGECIPNLLKKEYTEEVREKLMLVSLLGGMVITLTGVTIAHGMGYCYTYFHDIPHGRANGLLMKAYLPYCYSYEKKKIDISMQLLGTDSIEEFLGQLESLLGAAPAITSSDVDKYTGLTMVQKGSIANTPGDLSEEQIRRLWTTMSTK